MKETIRLTGALTLICIVATALLAWVNDLTKAPIAAAAALQRAEALEAVLPPFDNDPFADAITLPTEDGEFQLLPGRKAGELVGIAISGYTTQGFSGRIDVMVGFDIAKKIRLVMVSKHAETPGLGTKVCDRTAQKTIFTLFEEKKSSGPVPNIFLDQFNGMGVDAAATVTNYDTISGATVSSNALVDAIKRIANEYIKQSGESHE